MVWNGSIGSKNRTFCSFFDWEIVAFQNLDTLSTINTSWMDRLRMTVSNSSTVLKTLIVARFPERSPVVCEYGVSVSKF